MSGAVNVLYNEVTVKVDGEWIHYLEGTNGVKDIFINMGTLPKGINDVTVTFEDDSAVSYLGYPCIMRGKVSK